MRQDDIVQKLETWVAYSPHISNINNLGGGTAQLLQYIVVSSKQYVSVVEQRCN